jgi:hypothetical protein
VFAKACELCLEGIVSKRAGGERRLARPDKAARRALSPTRRSSAARYAGERGPCHPRGRSTGRPYSSASRWLCTVVAVDDRLDQALACRALRFQLDDLVKRVTGRT